ncbi:hypothetical protein HS121_17395 [bacterium]|nr:hypothetical protein [bacterium]
MGRLVISSMRILMAQRFDIANVGCAERIWRQAEQLQQQGHSITLVNFPHPERRSTYRAFDPMRRRV